MFWADIAGKDHDALDKHRVDMIALINKRNASSILKKGRRLTDRLFIAPQKQNSSHNESGFYEVSMDSNGNFSTTIPTTGWDMRPAHAAAAKQSTAAGRPVKSLPLFLDNEIVECYNKEYSQEGIWQRKPQKQVALTCKI